VPRHAIGFVLKGYPRLSETFIAQEIRGLEAAGLDIEIISLRHPTDATAHPVHGEIKAPVSYLPEYLYQEPWRGWRAARRRDGYRAARRAWLKDLLRDPTPNRVRRFGQALVLAAELAGHIHRLHAHFLHTPASVARYAAILRGLPWSCSAHARYIWTSPDWEIREKLADCSWAVTCSAAARDHLAALVPGRAAPKLVYHGLDLARFPPPGRVRPARDGGGADPVVVLTVGRLVEKKGHAVLIAALALLPPGLNWRLVHIGGGPLDRALRRQAADAGIADRITWLGAQPQQRVLAAYRDADLFTLASRIARDGDRDGLPNVLLEAQSQGLACVASRISAIPELIEDGETGLLVPPDDPAALALALRTLITDPARRAALGGAGETRVRGKFSHRGGLDRLMQRFGSASPDLSVPAADPDRRQPPSCALHSTHP
jgi:glycosyltransferase involved in cell wall biosynthesis